MFKKGAESPKKRPKGLNHRTKSPKQPLTEARKKGVRVPQYFSVNMIKIDNN